MNKEDYNKFYIQGSEHYLIPKDVFDELFDEMENWKEENQELKAELQLYKGSLKREHEAIHRVNELEEVIDKAIDYVENGDLLYLANKCSIIYRDNVEVVSICDRLNELLTKLKEVK